MSALQLAVSCAALYDTRSAGRLRTLLDPQANVNAANHQVGLHIMSEQAAIYRFRPCHTCQSRCVCMCMPLQSSACWYNSYKTATGL